MEIQQFIKDNEDMRVAITGDIYYNQRDIVNQSMRLRHGFFKNPVENADGFVDVFTRKSWIPFRTAVQGVDLDIKDAKVSTNVYNRQFLLDILKMIYHSHMEKTFFGEFLDELKEETIWFGSTVTKRANGTIYTVDWRNYITESNQPDPQLRRHAELIERPYEFMISNKKNWDNFTVVEETWKKMVNKGLSTFNIIDYWTWEEIDKKIHKVCKRYLDTSLTASDEVKTGSDWNPYVHLETFKTPYTIKCHTKAEKIGRAHV